MWDITNYYMRRYAKNLKKTQERRKRVGSELQFRRVKAELSITYGFGKAATVIPARLMLNDFNAQSIKIFTPTQLQPDQTVAITIEHPKYFYIRGKVKWCHLISTEGRVISPTQYIYRLKVEFTFHSQEERKAVAEFIHHVLNPSAEVEETLERRLRSA